MRNLARDTRTARVVIGALLMVVRALWAAGAVQAQEPARPDELKAGKFIYERSCAICHGPRGAGDGLAAAQLDPAPRDFTRGLFKFRSTPSGTMPTLEDLARPVPQGVTGTPMNQWSEL